MKTKWQVWAHLLCTNYSITALKKITSWLRAKDIIDLDWGDVCVNNSHKGEPHDRTYFMEWYKDESPTCATYPRLAGQIEARYRAAFLGFNRSVASDIRKCYEADDMDFTHPS